MANAVILIKNGTPQEVSVGEIPGLKITFSGDNNKVVVGDGCSINNLNIIIDGKNNRVELGRRLSLHNTTIMLNGNGCDRRVMIKQRTYIGGAFLQVLGSGRSIEIGADCMLSTDTNIVTDFAVSIYEKGGSEKLFAGNVKIGNHVWIGRNAYIYPDTVIPDDNIVGVKSVVQGRFTEIKASIAGNPARVVKKGINFIKCPIDNFEVAKKYMEDNMKTAVVTGANGFVGTWLVKELVENDVQVYAVIKDEQENISMFDGLHNVKIVYCELDSIRSLPEKIGVKGIDAFYHLAWVGAGGALRADYTVQLNNAKYSCDAAYAAKQMECKKFLCAGTITENIVDSTLGMDNVSQNMMYGISKKTTHLMLNTYCKMIDMPLVWMQFSNIYGPGNFSGNLISYTMTELINGRRPAFSAGTQPYDFIYIKDLVQMAYLLGFMAVPERTYFLGSGSSRLLCEYLSQIPQILGDGCEVGIGERPEDGIKYEKEWFDTENLKRDTGFTAKYTFEDGIKETYKWIKEMKEQGKI